jgi:thiol-disulfide isomerase/thioredoxin
MRILLTLLAVFAILKPSGAVDLEKLSFGRWALLFVVIPGCPACERVLPWFSQAAQDFPAIRFLLVAPWATEELATLAGDFPVYIDHGGKFGASLGVKRAPTLVLLARGMIALRLEWPFDEAKLQESLAEFLTFQVPDPQSLLGKRAPDFSAKDLAGEAISLESFPKPLLLVFFNPAYPRCWEDLPILVELSKEVRIALLAVGKISTDERERLRGRAGERIIVLFTEEIRILEAYQVVWSPTYFLLDGEGW